MNLASSVAKEVPYVDTNHAHGGSGRQLRVLFVCGGNSAHFEIAPFIKSQGESLRSIGANVSYFAVKGKGVGGYLSAARRLRQLLRRERFDVVHAHYAYSALVAILAGSSRNLVASFMGSDLYGVHGQHGKLTPIGYFNIMLSRLVALRAGSVIVKSRGMLGYLPRRVADRAYVVPNGVDLEKLQPMDSRAARRELGLRSEGLYLLFLGNPEDHRKGYTVLREALPLVTREDLELLTPYPVPHDEVPLLLNAADVLVFPSAREGSPNLVKEAMACNLPVVSTDVGDIREVIGDTEGCFVVDRDPVSLAEGIKQAIAFGGRTAGRGKIKHLDLNAVAWRVASIYGSLTETLANKKDADRDAGGRELRATGGSELTA